MRTPLDTRPCRSFAEALSDRAERQFEQAGALSRIDSVSRDRGAANRQATDWVKTAKLICCHVTTAADQAG
jgi:hypothetical protein